jgi:hypothetical protein
VRAKTSNEPFDEDLEDGCRDKSVEQTNDCIVDVPEAANPYLADEEDSNGNKGGEERGSPDGYDFIPQRIRKLRVNDLAVLESNWEPLLAECMFFAIHGKRRTRKATTGGWLCKVDTKADSTHDGHCQDIQSRCFDPLSEGWACVPGWGTTVSRSFIFAAKDSGLLLTRACGRGGIGVNWRWAPLEEGHIAVIADVYDSRSKSGRQEM